MILLGNGREWNSWACLSCLGWNQDLQLSHLSGVASCSFGSMQLGAVIKSLSAYQRNVRLPISKEGSILKHLKAKGCIIWGSRIHSLATIYAKTKQLESLFGLVRIRWSRSPNGRSFTPNRVVLETYFLEGFTPKIGEIIQFDEHSFQMGWFNHQLGIFSDLQLNQRLTLKKQNKWSVSWDGAHTSRGGWCFALQHCWQYLDDYPSWMVQL